MNKVIGPIALSYIRHIYEYSYLNNFENSIYEQNRNLRNFDATFTNINGAKKFVTCSTIPALVIHSVAGHLIQCCHLLTKATDGPSQN